METFFWSLALAAVTALTFLAYRHPDAFARRIFPPLAFLVAFVFCMIGGLYMGRMDVLTDTLPREVAKAKVDSNILKATSDLIVAEYARLKQTLFATAVVLMYLLLLRLLPTILGSGNQLNSNDESQQNRDDAKDA